MRTRTRRSRTAGFTLAEGLIAAVILAMAVVSFSAATASGHRQAQEFVLSHQAARLAAAMADQVAALPYDDPQGPSSPGPEPGETAAVLFDNADDYHGYAEAAGQLKDAGGNLFPAELQEFSRSVTVQADTVTASALGGTVPGLAVTVTVQYVPTGRSWTLRTFICEPAE